MALTPDLQLAEYALDELEQLEARCLVWGLVENSLSDSEVDEALQRVLRLEKSLTILGHSDCNIRTRLDLKGKLVALKMLFEVHGLAGERLWRTRMAEGVRLIAQLRQLFPKHADPGEWARAPTLVADYRFVRRSRRYPNRDQGALAVYDRLSQTIDTPQLRSALNVWLNDMKSQSLAEFQVRSTERIFGCLEAGKTSGTLVSAGTGSGKTLAFYLPALAWLASQRVQSPSAKGVRVLALYPRNELLKDQLAEVWDQCRKFDAWLAKQGGRPLRIGVLYGETPQALSGFLPDGVNSKRTSFFKCPVDPLHGEMVLRRADVAKGLERLVCNECGMVVDSHTLAFTRQTISKDPPDILFTTVEMLNRHLSNNDLRHVFGVGPNAERAPDLMLLDEVHLYAGTYGAQVAYLLRRWWAASQRRSSFVGLSATIADGRAFFASLTGLADSAVEEIVPHDQDMVSEGAEYMLALRGDPVSQTALLSTTIQTLMLGARLLDTPQTFDRKDNPFFGWRAFAFTDQLDAANRLFKDLLDAEARYYPSGNPIANRAPLAELRTRKTQEPDRYFAGQDWRVAEEIGHQLNNRLEVARTTSLDSGVSNRSEIVVATAALEVGFDDPAVGVVVQHKAPRDIASFLQRKGRAGRTRHTRPWTIVTLSDYGRDRLTYQAYDQLFDPDLPPRQLPLANRYVQRMQAVYALLDQLSDWTCRRFPALSVWRDLSKPINDEHVRRWGDGFRKLQKLAESVKEPAISWTEWQELKNQVLALAPPNSNGKLGIYWFEARLRRQRGLRVLSEVLQSTDKAENLAACLASRLALTTDEMNVLMWSQPRPVMVGAIPTLVRRLSSGWRSQGRPGEDLTANHPLPDYIPGSLFSDLSLPEMKMILPENGKRAVHYYLPVQQGLAEFAPGRVSRRYEDASWLGLDVPRLDGYVAAGGHVEDDVDIESWYVLEPQRPFVVSSNGTRTKYNAFLPHGVKLGKPPEKKSNGMGVADTSNALLKWESFMLTPQQGAKMIPPPHLGISTLIKHILVHTHAAQCPVLVRRYAISSNADLRVLKGNKSDRVTVDWRFMQHGQPAAVGFDIEVDALILVLNLPGTLHNTIDWSNPERLRAARASRYNWEARQNLKLCTEVQNPFLRGWIAQIFQIGALQVAVADGCSLADALDKVEADVSLGILKEVLETVFQLPIAKQGEEGSDRLRQALLEALSSGKVRAAVREAANVLVNAIDASWDEWLATTIRATLGAACLEAIQQACPQVDTDALIVDIDIKRDDGTCPATAEIWISETSPGGNGLIEDVANLLSIRPDNLYRHIEAALSPRDFEYTNTQLRAVVQWLGGPLPDSEVTDAVTAVRRATSSAEASEAFAQLRCLLTARGQAVFHGYSVALSMRLLRPNSPGELDQLLAEIHSRWDDIESNHGVEVDVRVLCALFCETGELDQALGMLGMVLPSGDRRAWRFGVMLGLLWPQGHALRAVGLPWSNRFSPYAIDTERLLLENWLTVRPPAVDPHQPGWEALVREQLINCNESTVTAPAAEAAIWLPKVVASMATEPVQFDYLNVFPELSGIKRNGDMIEWNFSIPDFA